MAADSSTSAQRRRATKPLIEKRRRARINSSLAQLKEIVADASSKVQETRSNRLEKADILELTVDYVRNIHGRKSIKDNTVDGSDPDGRSFKEGYRLCMTEVQRFFSNNYHQQASKQFIHRSLQSYLQKTLRDTNDDAKSLCIGADLEEQSPTRCQFKSARLDAVPFIRNDFCDSHCENSNFSHSYSSASTDDEITGNYSASEAESNVQAKDFNFLQSGLASKRTSTYHNHSGTNTAQDKMWRPW